MSSVFVGYALVSVLVATLNAPLHAVELVVTAKQIIEEIKRLDPKDQLGVIRFAYQIQRSPSGSVVDPMFR